METKLRLAGAIPASRPFGEGSGSPLETYCDLLEHELLNLNQIALGYLELTVGIPEPGAQQIKDNQSLIMKAANALKESSLFIGNFRKLRRVDPSGKRQKPIDVFAMLSALKEQYSSAGERDITIACERQASCNVYFDEFIQDIFSCLIWHAIRRSDTGIPLEIRLVLGEVRGKEGKYCQVTIEDNGPGIPDDQKAMLFSRSSGAGASAAGAPLNLYLVKVLVDRYRGRVWVENRVMDDYTKGSKFVVLLPANSRINRL